MTAIFQPTMCTNRIEGFSCRQSATVCIDMGPWRLYIAPRRTLLRSCIGRANVPWIWPVLSFRFHGGSDVISIKWTLVILAFSLGLGRYRAFQEGWTDGWDNSARHLRWSVLLDTRPVNSDYGKVNAIFLLIIWCLFDFGIEQAVRSAIWEFGCV